MIGIVFLYSILTFGKIQAAVNGHGFEARGALSFIPEWSTVLTNPTLQIASESMTGWKEVCFYISFGRT